MAPQVVPPRQAPPPPCPGPSGGAPAVCRGAAPPCRWVGLAGGGGSGYGNSGLARVAPGKIVFPKSGLGKHVSIEGVVASVARDPDPEAKAVAAEYGQENPGAPAFWELKVTGAVVQ